MSDVVWTVTCGLYVPSNGAASGLHLFVSPRRVATALKVGTYVPRCTASFSRTLESFFDVLLTVHLGIFISVINQLDAQIFCFTISSFHASTCFEHYLLIIRRSKLYYGASGFITPIGGRRVHRLRKDSSLNLWTGRPPIDVMKPEAV